MPDDESNIQSMLQLTGIQEFLSQVDTMSKKAAAILTSNMTADKMEASYIKAFENIAKTIAAFSVKSKRGVRDVVDLLVSLEQYTQQQGDELALMAGNLSKMAQGEAQVKTGAQAVTVELTKQEATLQKLNNLLREIAIAESRMAQGAGSSTIYGEHGVSVQEARSEMNMPQLGSTDITEENLQRTRTAIEERIDAMRRLALVEKDAANAVANLTVKDVEQKGGVLDLKAKINELNDAIEATAKNLGNYEQKGQMGAAKIAQTNIDNLTKDLVRLEQQLIKTSAIGKESLGALGAEPIPLRASALGAPDETVMRDLLNRSLDRFGVSLAKYEPSAAGFETAASKWGKDVERVLQEDMIARGTAARDQFQVQLKGTLFGADIGGTADIVDFQKKTVVDVKASSERVIADLKEYANGTKTFAEIGDRAKRYILQIETYARLLDQKLGLAAGTYKAGFQPITPLSSAINKFGANVTAATVTKPENMEPPFYVPRMQDVEYQKAIVAAKEQELKIMSSPEYQIPLVKYIEANNIAKERLGTQATISAEVAKEASAANQVAAAYSQEKQDQADSLLLSKGKVTLAEGALTIAKQEAAEAEKNVKLLGARQALVNTLLNTMKQAGLRNVPYEKALKSAIDISGLSEKTKGEFQGEYEKLSESKVAIERLENEKKLYAEAVRVNEAAQQRVKLAESELAAVTKVTDELTKQATAVSPAVAPSVRGVPTELQQETPQLSSNAIDIARQEYEQSVQVVAARERILAARRRELDLAKGTLDSIRKEKDSGDVSAEQLAGRVATQQRLVDQKNFEVQAGKKSLENSKAQVVADREHVKLLQAQRPATVQEDLSAYQEKINALVAQAQQTTPKSAARKEAIEDLKSESKQIEVMIAQRKGVILQREQELARIQQIAAAKKAAADEETQAAKAAQAVYMEAVQKRDPGAVIDLKNRAEALDKSASSARLSAASAKDNANAMQFEVQASRSASSQLSNMNSALKTNASALDDSEKKARTWQDRVFSLSRIVSVFWGTLLSSVAFKAMQGIQDFFSQSSALAIKAESSLIRFGVSVRATQRQMAEGFAGANEALTIGEFGGTIDSWTAALDKFAERWQVFTSQEVREGFQQILSITRTQNIGQGLQLQLMEVAGGLALLEEDFANNLPKAAEAVSRAIEGFTRPLHATFLGAIEDTDRAIKSMEMYGVAYTKLGKGDESLKKQQQALVNTTIILERYATVAEDIGLIYGTIEMRTAKYNRTLKEQQVEIGKITAPALLNLKAALIATLETLEKGATAGAKALGILQTAIMNLSLQSVKLGGGGIFGAAFTKMELPVAEKERVLRWAKLQVLEMGRINMDVAAEVAKKTNEGTISVIAFTQAAREQDVAAATRAKEDIDNRLANAKAALKKAQEAGAGPEEIARLEKWVKLYEQAEIDIKGVATALEDTNEVGKLLKDTASAENWMPDPMMVADLGDKIKDAWESADEKRVEAGEDRNEKYLESWEKMLDDIAKAHNKAEEAIVKNAEDAADDIVKAHKKASRATQDAWKNYQDSVEEAWQGYYDDLAQKRDDDAEETEKRWRDHLRKLEDLEIDHQRRLRDIQQQFEYDLDTAAQERDAKQIFALIRKNQFDVKNENQSYSDRVDDENRHFAQEEEERKRQAEIERQRRWLELQHTLENLKIEYDRRLEDIKEALREEIDEALAAQKEKDADAREQELKDKAAALAAMGERNADIQDGYDKQLETIEKELKKQYRALLKGLRDQVDLTADNMKKMYDAVALYIGPDGQLRTMWDEWLKYLAYAKAYADSVAAAVPVPPTSEAPPEEPGAPVGGNTPQMTASAQQMAASNMQSVPTLPPVNQIQPWEGVLKIEVTADDHFSVAFEDKVIDSITTAVKGMRR